jgi:hypothetical protein
MDVISTLIKKLIDENAGATINQSQYNKQYDDYAERFNKAKEKHNSLQKQEVKRLLQADIIECFMIEINTLPDLPIEYSDRLWNAMIDYVTVYNDERLEFIFKNGEKITKTL